MRACLSLLKAPTHSSLKSKGVSLASKEHKGLAILEKSLINLL